MRKLLLIIPIVIFIATGCKKVLKDVNDYYPAVKIVSAEQLPDGTVNVTAEITQEGSADLTYLGFCMDTVSNPNIESNQVIVDTLYGNTYSTIYSSLTKSKKYYFKAWCANGNGYAVSDNEVSIDSVTISSSIVPCDLPLDTITITTTQSTKVRKYYTVSKIRQSGLSWTIDMDTYQGEYMQINFGQKPTSGVYKMVSSVNNKGYLVGMLVSGYAAKAGSDVYVQEISSNEIEVTICSADVNSIQETTIKTRFRAKY